MTAGVTHQLLAGLIDYAGLFPPASESMHNTVHHYQEYLASAQSWIMGRLIVPLDHLDEFSTEMSGLLSPSAPWQISCLWPATAIESAATITSACERMQGCMMLTNRGGSRKIAIDTIEVPCHDVEGIRRLSDLLPEPFRGFVEVPISPVSESYLDLLQDCDRLAAKIRTGGVTPQAIPPVDRLLDFLQAATERRLAFKCTAGLHHPLPGERRLTYQPNAPVGTMHGFWNVAVATGCLLSGAVDRAAMRQLLQDENALSFCIGHDQLAWKSQQLSVTDVALLRRHGFQSFGSCSFLEPIADLQQLGWLPVAGPLRGPDN